MGRKEQCRRCEWLFCLILMAAAQFAWGWLCPCPSVWSPLSPCRPSAGAIPRDCHCPCCVTEDADLTSHLSILHSSASLLLSFVGYVPSAPLTMLLSCMGWQAWWAIWWSFFTKTVRSAPELQSLLKNFRETGARWSKGWVLLQLPTNLLVTKILGFPSGCLAA